MATGAIRIERSRLVRACAGYQIVVLAAPYGAGKSVLACQLADAHPGARVHIGSLDDADDLCIRICDAWGLPASAAGHGVAPLCASLGGPGIVVVDPLGATASPSLLAELVAALPPDVGLVVCTRDAAELSSIDIVKLGADGRLVLLGLDDLRFDADELARLGSGAGRHSGWPIAEMAATGPRPPDEAALCRAALAAAPDQVRSVVALLAPCATVDQAILEAVAGARGTELVAEWTWLLSPSVASVADGIVHFTAAAATTPSSAPVAVDVSAVDAAAARVDPAQAAMSVDALIVLQRWDAAAALLDKAARTMLSEGHGSALARWVRRIPEENRTLALAFAATFAGLNTGEAGVADLEALHDRIWVEEPDLGPWAAATVAWAMLGVGDTAFFTFFSEAMTRVLGGFPTPEDLERRIGELPRSARGDALHLVMVAVQLLLLARQPDTRDQACALVAAVEEASLRLGRPFEAARALFAVGDIFTGGRTLGDPAVSVLPLVEAAPRLTGMWCLLRLMFAAVRFGDVVLLKALVARLEGWLVQVPDLCVGDVSPPEMALAAMRYFIATISGDAADAGDELDGMWHAHLGHHSNSARVSAILVALCRLEADDTSGARFWHGRASERWDNRYFLLQDLEILELRLVLRESGSEAALDALERRLHLYRDQGQHGSVAMLQRWLILDLAAIGRTADALGRLTTAVSVGEVPVEWETALRARIEAPQSGTELAAGGPTLRFLDTEVAFDDGTGGERAVRGLQAMLLTVLATRNGRVEVDRAVDLLFGDVDVDSGRQRLYTTVYRTRKQLGLGAPALRVEDGVVRLDDSGVRVDVWDFERGVDSTTGGGTRAALDLYRDDLCSRQFAYEDFAEEPRRMLRTRYVRAVVQYLDGVLGAGEPDARDTDLARRAWRICPDDEDLCARVARVLARAGHRGEALEVVRATAGHLEDLGVPSELEHLVADDLGPASGRGHPIGMGSPRPEPDFAG